MAGVCLKVGWGDRDVCGRGRRPLGTKADVALSQSQLGKNAAVLSSIPAVGSKREL